MDYTVRLGGTEQFLEVYRYMVNVHFDLRVGDEKGRGKANQRDHSEVRICQPRAILPCVRTF